MKNTKLVKISSPGISGTLRFEANGERETVNATGILTINKKEYQLKALGYTYAGEDKVGCRVETIYSVETQVSARGRFPGVTGCLLPEFEKLLKDEAFMRAGKEEALKNQIKTSKAVIKNKEAQIKTATQFIKAATDFLNHKTNQAPQYHGMY